MSRFIAAITASAFSKDIVNAVGNGMNNHPSKPIDIKVL
jgi:CheY-like chemotaxis protein